MIEFRHVREHIEVYQDGEFVVSADTESEAQKDALLSLPVWECGLKCSIIRMKPSMMILVNTMRRIEMTCKCKDCTDRYVGCHSTCEDYKKFQEENEKAKKAIREANRTVSLNSDGTMFAGKGGIGKMRHKINGR